MKTSCLYHATSNLYPEVDLGLGCCTRSCSSGEHWFDCCVNQKPAKADSGALVVSGQGQGFGREVPKPTASNGSVRCMCYECLHEIMFCSTVLLVSVNIIYVFSFSVGPLLSQDKGWLWRGGTKVTSQQWLSEVYVLWIFVWVVFCLCWKSAGLVTIATAVSVKLQDSERIDG